jgi:hypothetical protein
MGAEPIIPDLELSIAKPEVIRTERWKLHASIGIFVCSFLLLSMSTCGCHFHPDAVIPMIAPLFWTIFLLASYRSTKSRLGAWAAFVIAVCFLWLGFESNLKFAPFWTGMAEFLMDFSKTN